MKIRSGFVSNSSSASFILSLDKGVDIKKIKTTLTVNLDINKCDNRKYKNIEEFKKDVESGKFPVDDEEFEKCIKALEDGKTIVVGFVESNCFEDDIAKIFLYLFGEDIVMDGCEFI